LYLLAVSYVSMAVAGLALCLAFQAAGLAPAHVHVSVFDSRPAWNYTTFLDLGALVLVAALGWRFLTTGGPAMLRAMSKPEEDTHTTDPVCGMAVDPGSAPRHDHGGRTYFFCSEGCRPAALPVRRFRRAGRVGLQLAGCAAAEI